MMGSFSMAMVGEGEMAGVGDSVACIEVMKTLQWIQAPVAGRVHLMVEFGELVNADDVVFEIDTED